MLDNICEFNRNGVIDTCSLLNLLSSSTLSNASKIEKCNFIISDFIEYELLYKKRNIEDELRRSRAKELDLLISESIKSKEIIKYDIALSDLLNPAFDRYSKAKSLGELTAIVLAEKFNIGVISDDKKAQNIACNVIGKERVDSVCSLISWMYYHNILSDSDKDKIIKEQAYFFRNQETKFQEAYERGLEKRLMNS